MELFKLKELAHIARVCNAIVNDEEEVGIKYIGESIEIEFLDTKIITDGENFSSVINDIKLVLKLDDVEKLYNYVTVQVMRVTGMDRHKDICISPFDLPEVNWSQIKRVIRYELDNETGETLFKQICFAIGSPNKVGNDLGITPRLVKNIRFLNRKNIINWAKEEAQKEENTAI